METWKEIPGYEGYYMISDKGNVKSVARSVSCFSGRSKVIKGMARKPCLDKDGYHVVLLSKTGGRKLFKIHRLVAISFLPSFDGKDFVNHIDGNKTNNNVANLEWVTHKENMEHASLIIGLKGRRKTNICAENKTINLYAERCFP